jgi:hypothetical protein
MYWNAYYDSSEFAYKYIVSNEGANRLLMTSGDFGFYVAPAGTAGDNISWTNAMYITSSGNVGIGTTNPEAKLDVNGNIWVRSTAIGGTGVRISPSGIEATGAATDNYLYLSGTGINKGATIIQKDGGNVGIGTTSPGYKLDVTGDIHSTTGITSDGTYPFIIGTTGFAYLPSNTSHIAYYKKSGTYEYYWRKSDNGYPGGANESTLAMLNDYGRFYVSGSIGIGTTAPQVTLHVKSTYTTAGVRVDAPSSQQVGYQWAKDGSIKWSAYIDANSNDLKFWDGTNVRVTFASGGNVGIGTAIPSATLEVKAGGTTLADAWSTRSSRRWKENIQPIDDPLGKVMRLRGVYFNWKANGKHDIGMIAEEVGEVIPEVVTYEDNGKDAKSLDYARLVSVLVEAIKEQQKEIEKLRLEIEELKKQR